MSTTVIFLIIGLVSGALFGALPAIVIGRLRNRAKQEAALSDVKGEMALLQQRCTAAEAEVVRLQAEEVVRQSRYEDSGRKAAVFEGHCQSAEKQIEDLKERLLSSEKRSDQLTSTIRDNQGIISGLEANVAALRRESDEKLKLLTDARDQLKSEFQNLANNIFDEKTRKFSEQSKANLDLVLDPFRTQLGDFRRRVDDVYASEAKDRQALSEHIKILTVLNQQVSKEADNLTRALKGENKTQGNWGEMILERALELSGLKKGAEYDTQVHSVDIEGNRHLPDVVVHLPEGRDIVVDSKVSLTAYEGTVGGATEEERNAAMTAHIQSVRGHIDQLSAKSYDSLPNIRSLDYVLMFMPIEAAFVAVIRSDTALFEYAYGKRIIIVSPSTLLVTLRTIQNMWQSEHQNRNAQEIARKAADLYDKFAGFVDTLIDVRKAIGGAADKCETAVKQLSEGRGNIVRKIEEFRGMGVKMKKSLPAGMIESVDEQEE